MHSRFSIAFLFRALVGTALLAWALPEAIGGNGLLSVFLCGIILGNSDIVGKKELAHFFNGFTGLMQVFIFFMVGILAKVEALWAALVPAIFVYIFLSLIARPAGVFAILSPMRKFPLRQQMLVSFAGLRGAPAVVFSVFAVSAAGPILEHDLFSIVFLVVLFSICINGMLLPKVAHSLGMVDSSEDVNKNFNDFFEETSWHFTEILIGPDSRWAGKAVMDLGLQKDMLLSLVVKADGSTYIPNGHSVLEEGDTAVVCSRTFRNEKLLKIIKRRLYPGDRWINQTIRETPAPKNSIMLVVHPDGSTEIGHSSTLLREGDLLYINASAEKNEKA